MPLWEVIVRNYCNGFVSDNLKNQITYEWLVVQNLVPFSVLSFLSWLWVTVDRSWYRSVADLCSICHDRSSRACHLGYLAGRSSACRCLPRLQHQCLGLSGSHSCNNSNFICNASLEIQSFKSKINCSLQYNVYPPVYSSLQLRMAVEF